MKAMKMTAKYTRGDDFNRLLSYLKKQFRERIVKMVPIRDSVFLVTTEKNNFVVKGYSKYRKLRIQETFTETLRQEGFLKTYLFVQHLVNEPLFFDGKYYGCMEYLQPSKNTFAFHSHKNRKEGLELLSEFHQITASFVSRYKTILHESNIQEKWLERLTTFSSHTPRVGNYLDKSSISELFEWSKWSLQGMKENDSLLTHPKVILHGDVAHHNFLRDSSEKLNLIDFDLLSIGPECFDILQYANRILPSINWSFDRLSQYPQINKYLQEKAFLYALGYPTDIFREWNRLFREKRHYNQSYRKQVLDLTINQFHLRKQFVSKLKSVLEKI